ncbi:unnamed protein product [Caenorhabditis bovis]|uniref:DOMON domain-containing protein n=1 Tax=Caenorhabditis bovis TaxID=2654633 RepID=A0A8S1EBB7_9PELO|nr:unnamed protein product [Caenorhabditis bovis]
MRFLVVLLVIPFTMAAICPMEKHQVCNIGTDLACTCAVSESEESPIPEASCNAFIARDLETGNFPAVSVEFNIDDDAEGLDEWPEAEFREKITSSLRVDDNDLIILRANCKGTDDSLTVQFVILKKDANATNYPYQVDDLIDSESIATRMKAMGHLSQIANLDVDSIESTEELIDIEYDPSNVELALKTFAFGVVFGIFFVMGILKLRKGNNEYNDDLQKA